jgi:hypothetical protein
VQPPRDSSRSEPNATDPFSCVLNTPTSRRQLLKFLAGSAAAGAFFGMGATGLRTPRLALAAPPDNDPFMLTWQRTDRPVADNQVSRTWMWGPEAFTPGLIEEYAEAPSTERRVQYFDKSRMEDNSYNTTESPWNVTNGLLVLELITGRMQLGDNAFEQHPPATVNVVGDPGTRPTYADFGPLLDVPGINEGDAVSWRLQADGTVDTTDPGGELASRGVLGAHYVSETEHTVAGPFWEFMNSSGVVYQDGQFTEDLLFPNAYYATGFPITEAYWTTVNVGGSPREVLAQCFERRVLTYTPDNDPGWQVEAGNVGRHYYQWRYDDATFCVPTTTNHKPKTNPATKLQTLADNTRVPSVMAGAFVQLARRYTSGASPANALETRAFDAFDQLPAATMQTLGCSIGRLDTLPPTVRDVLIDSRFGSTDATLDVDVLTQALGEEITGHMSEALFDDPDCLNVEHSGAVRRFIDFIDGVIFVNPRIFRINNLRTEAFNIAIGEYAPEELQQQCTLVPIDTDGDGVPDSSQLSCSNTVSPCVGTEVEGVCLRIPEVRAGDIVKLVGVNFFTDAKVSIQPNGFAGTTHLVDAQVCGDLETPVSEIVDGVSRDITDTRVKDQLAFALPAEIQSGVYRITVTEPNNTGVGPAGDLLSNVEFIRVIAPPSAVFSIASERLFCKEQTSGEWGDDEVGIRVLTIPIGLDGLPGALQEQKFRFGDLETGDDRDMTRVLFDGNNISGLAMAILGHEVDSEKAYREQVEGFIDAFVFVVKELWDELGTGAAAAAIKKLVSGLSGWAIAIAAAVALAIVIFVALWAPADLLMEDTLGLTALDLDILTSANYPAAPIQITRSPGGIKVTATTESKTVEYHQRRSYRSDDEDAVYDIILRYNRLA